MYSGSTRPETATTYPQYERRISYPNDQPVPHPYTRPYLELPRPLEPRPTLQTSLSEASGIQRRQEPFGPNVDQRAQGQNLPSVRDILSPPPQTSRPPAYNPTWHAPSGPSVQPRSNDGWYRSESAYLPHTLHRPANATPSAQPQQTRVFEVPILDTSPVSRQSSQAFPNSPYGYGYSSAVRDYADGQPERHGEPLPGSYVTNGAPSPYSSSTHDELPLRSPLPAHERAEPPAYPSTGAENQKKYLGVRSVAGEGAYHFYEGGYRIPTHVDGEQVNPAWGLTKANKPRKRLALACLDCREKKIKCEPGVSSCLQCEKAKRPCRRAPIQSQTETASTSSWPGSADSAVRKTASASDPTPSSNRMTDSDLLSKRRMREDSSPPNFPSKKHRSASPIVTCEDEATLSRDVIRQTNAALPADVPCLLRDGSDAALSWEEDPYTIDPRTTLYLLDLYFAHINNSTYCMFPRRHFLDWVEHGPQKCQNERLVLYAVLAVASVFAGDELSGVGRRCACIVKDALPSQSGRPCLTVAQAQMLLALYQFSKGANELAWANSGLALRTTAYLHLNTERGCLNDQQAKESQRVEFALSGEQLTECKRRTFWSAFLMDRFCGASHCVFKNEDIFLRLPYTDDMYEQGVPSEAPHFGNDTIDPAEAIITALSPLAPMAWLVLVAAIWGDVVDFVFRVPHRPATTYRDSYEAFYESVCMRLQGWSTRLPDHLKYCEYNLNQSIQHGYASTFISMHALQHFSMIKLNRCLQHSVAPDLVGRNIRTAHAHAHEMLRIVKEVYTARREAAANAEGRSELFPFTTPFLGYAALSAVDVAGAGGPDSTLPTTINEIDVGLEFLRELARYWDSAKDQSKACEMRSFQIRNVTQRPVKSRSGAWLGRQWGLEKPLEQELEAKDDCIYGLELEAYFSAFNDDEEQSKATAGGLRIG